MRIYYTTELSSSMRRLALFTDIIQHIAQCNFDNNASTLNDISEYVDKRISGFTVHKLELKVNDDLLTVENAVSRDVVLRVRAFTALQLN
jgi:hypothetical protein